MWIGLLRSIAIGLGVGIMILWVFPQLRHSESAADLIVPAQQPESYHQAVSVAAPTVVYVYNRAQESEIDSNNTEDQKPLSIQTLGSGVIMTKDGYILTNKHVVSGAEQIVVSLQDGSTYEAKLIGSDHLTDLAVLKIDTDNLPFIPVNLERKTRVGDVVLAIGNPLNLGVSITQGIISATGRVSLSQSGRQNFLQTDAAINHGNSGGALVNSLGELVGINTLSIDKESDNHTQSAQGGLNFAIPTELAMKIMEKLIADGKVIRGYLGITGGDVKLTAEDNSDEITGIYVSDFDINGPAAKAGIHKGDVIIQVNDLPIFSTLSTLDRVAEIKPNTVIPIVVIRDEQPVSINLVVDEFPEED